MSWTSTLTSKWKQSLHTFPLSLASSSHGKTICDLAKPRSECKWTSTCLLPFLCSNHIKMLASICKWFTDGLCVSCVKTSYHFRPTLELWKHVPFLKNIYYYLLEKQIDIEISPLITAQPPTCSGGDWEFSPGLPCRLQESKDLCPQDCFPGPALAGSWSWALNPSTVTEVTTKPNVHSHFSLLFILCSFTHDHKLECT